MSFENKQQWEHSVKILGVKIDYKLTFNSHISKIYKKAGRKRSEMNRLQERCLKIICNGKITTFKQLLKKDSYILTDILHP